MRIVKTLSLLSKNLPQIWGSYFFSQKKVGSNAFSYTSNRYLNSNGLKTTYTKSELDEAKKIAFDEGKREGMAYGVVALFSQDRIKKPEEMVVNTHLLELSENDLDLVALIRQYELSESIEMIKILIEGDRCKALAMAIKSEDRSWEICDPPVPLPILKILCDKPEIYENKSVEELAQILGDFYTED